MVSAGTLLAATTQPVCRSELKYSIVYPMRGEAPGLGLDASCQDTVMEDWVALRICGWGGGLGYVEGSGMRCRFGAAVFSTVREADHEVSPLSELAVQVYNPESLSCKSVTANQKLLLTLYSYIRFQEKNLNLTRIWTLASLVLTNWAILV